MDFLELVIPELSPEKVSSDTAQTLHTTFVDVWYRARKAATPEIEHKATSAMIAHRAHVKRAGS